MSLCTVTFKKKNPGNGDGAWRIAGLLFHADKPVKCRPDIAGLIKAKHADYVEISGDVAPWQPQRPPARGSWDISIRLPDVDPDAAILAALPPPVPAELLKALRTDDDETLASGALDPHLWRLAAALNVLGDTGTRDEVIARIKVVSQQRSEA